MTQLQKRKAEIWDDVIEQLAQGRDTIQLATQYGISDRTLRHWIMLDEQADQARAAYFAQEMDEAYQDLKNADNGLTLAKSKERLHHIRHLAEVRAKRYFGKDPAITINMLTGDQAIQRIQQLEQELGYIDSTAKTVQEQPSTNTEPAQAYAGQEQG